MWYAIISQDIEDSLALRKETRPAHLARLQELKAQDRLLIAGPHPAVDDEDPGSAGFSGSLVVAEFEDLAAAEDWAKSDPYMLEGVYASVTVKPFNKVLP